MNNRSRSTLFLIEQLIVIAVFALCAAACARILTSAYMSARDARDLGNAFHNAESCAESFKAAGGDLSLVKDILGGNSVSINGDYAVIVYYNSKWAVCGENGASYRLILTAGSRAELGPQLREGDITVERLDGEELFAITVAARGKAD